MGSDDHAGISDNTVFITVFFFNKRCNIFGVFNAVSVADSNCFVVVVLNVLFSHSVNKGVKRSFSAFNLGERNQSSVVINMQNRLNAENSSGDSGGL